MDMLNQIRTNSTELPSHARLSRGSEAVIPVAGNQTGLWACRVNSTYHEHGPSSIMLFVGIYRRGQGEHRMGVAYIASESSAGYLLGVCVCVGGGGGGGASIF